MQRYKGILSVTVLRAENLPSKDFIGRNDNYAVVSLNKPPVENVHQNKEAQNETCQQTQVQDGANPIWNEKLAFSVAGSLDVLYLQVFDEDPGKDEFIGSGEIDFRKLTIDAKKHWLDEPWIELRNEKGAPAGRVKLILHFVPESTFEYYQKKYDSTQAGIKQRITEKVVGKLTGIATGQIKGMFGMS